MKALETEYNGVLFRSRLEARWAILFDLLKLKWVYEPECFVLSNNQKYTPDFYIEDFDLYIEIKPNFDWFNIAYHFERYEWMNNLLVLSGSYPNFNTNVLFRSEKELGIDLVFFNPFIIKKGWEYADDSVCLENLGLKNDYLDQKYKDYLKEVKSYRFWNPLNIEADKKKHNIVKEIKPKQFIENKNEIIKIEKTKPISGLSLASIQLKKIKLGL